VTTSEAALNMGGISAFMSSYFELQAALIRTAEAAGVSEPEACTYVTSLLSMLATTARHTAPEHFAGLVVEHQTKGGLNERVRATLLAAGWFAAPAATFDEINRLGWKKLG